MRVDNRHEFCPSSASRSVDDLQIKLLDYYFSSFGAVKKLEEKRIKSVLWMIENVPELSILGEPYADVDLILEPAAYKKCKVLWLRKLRENKKNVAIIVNAANFFRSDFNRARKLFTKAIALDPKEPQWSMDLALLLQLNAKNRSRMKTAMAAVQDAIRKTKKLEFKYSKYDYLAEVAFEAGELKIAKR